ncbi:MAG: AsmA-like C-terminal region-containing protein, partial [Bacteroidota bacterium]
RVKQEVNEQVDAEVDFGRFRLSVLRDFPDVSLSINDILVVNEAPFEGDTLADIGRVMVTIDLRSLFGDGGYEIKRIRFDSPHLYLQYLEDRSANWNIFPAVDEVDDEIASAEPSNFNLALQRIDIEDASLSYHDDVFLTYIDLEGLNGRFTGDLTQDITILDTRNARVESFSLRYDRIPILSNVRLDVMAEVEMNLKDWVFRFRENELAINELPVSFDGMVGLPEGGGTLMDFSFAATRSDFSAFLSLVPLVYAKDFEALQTSGSLELGGYVNGLLKGEQIPGFEIALLAEDGMFRYPDLPAAVSGVQVDALIANAGDGMDDVEVSVPELRMMLADNPVHAGFNIRTPISDPWVDMFLDGRLNLADVGDFFPLEENMVLEGIIESNVEARGFLSDLESQAFDRFHASGRVEASGIIVESDDLEERLTLSRAEALLSPQQLAITDFRGRFGDSDLEATGQIDNLLNYLFEDEMLSGQFDIRSDYLNVNQLMPDSPNREAELDESEEEGEPVKLTAIPVPANLDVGLQAEVGRLTYGDLDLRNIVGGLHIADQQAFLDPLAVDILKGRVTLQGLYDTRREQPDVSLSLDFSSIDIQEAFNTFNTVQLLAPLGEYAMGDVSGNLTLQSLFDDTLEPVLETLSGSGSLRSTGITVKNNPALVSLAERVKLDMFREWTLDHMSLSFSFADGRVDTRPFDVDFGQSEAMISGTTWFDRRIDYSMRVNIPREQFGSDANEVLDDLVARAAGMGVDVDPGTYVTLDVHAGGTVTDPELSVGMAGTVDDLKDGLRDAAGRLLQEAEEQIRDEVDRLRDQAEEEAREVIEDVQEDVSEELEARAQQVIDEAEQRAEQLRREAKNAADKVREEARKQAQNMIDGASGPIGKAAARVAGDTLIEEADRRANQIEEEADTRAQNLLDEAHRQADRIRRGEE